MPVHGNHGEFLAVSPRTIQRQPKGKVFDKNVSERAIKLAQLTAHGINVFGAKGGILHVASDAGRCPRKQDPHEHTRLHNGR